MSVFHHKSTQVDYCTGHLNSYHYLVCTMFYQKAQNLWAVYESSFHHLASPNGKEFDVLGSLISSMRYLCLKRSSFIDSNFFTVLFQFVLLKVYRNIHLCSQYSYSYAFTYQNISWLLLSFDSYEYSFYVHSFASFCSDIDLF